MGRTGRFDLDGALAAYDPPADTDTGLLGTLRQTQTRSAARHVLDAAMRDGAVQRPGRDALERWWSRGYLAAIAAQHGVGWLDFSARAGSETGSAPDGLHLQGDIVDRLAAMPVAAFMGVRFDAREALATWRAAGSARAREGALRDLAYVVLRACDAPRRRDARIGGALLLVALGAGLAGLALERTVAGSATWGLVAAIVVTLVQGAPWDALRTLAQIRRGRTRAVIHLAP